jgi:ABC-type polysaccharide/polyol phosphate export permease
MLDYAELIKKVRFPRQLVAFSVVATQLVPFVVLLAGLMVVNAIVIPETRDTVLLSIPIAAGIVVLVCGMALAVASANVVFRDVEHLLAALLLPWFFLTPILYSLEELPGGLEDYDVVVDLLRWANPLTPPLYALRDPLFYGVAPAAGDVVYLAVAAVVSLVVGALVFRRVDDRIAVEL